MRPGGAHARSCVLGEPERAEELGQQVWRQQDIHAPRWERRHLGDEGVGLVLEPRGALAGVHGKLQKLCIRELGQSQAAHETGGKERGPRTAISSTNSASSARGNPLRSATTSHVCVESFLLKNPFPPKAKCVTQ